MTGELIFHLNFRNKQGLCNSWRQLLKFSLCSNTTKCYVGHFNLVLKRCQSSAIISKTKTVDTPKIAEMEELNCNNLHKPFINSKSQALASGMNTHKHYIDNCKTDIEGDYSTHTRLAKKNRIDPSVMLQPQIQGTFPCH
jgi:hypothetical protein